MDVSIIIRRSLFYIRILKRDAPISANRFLSVSPWLMPCRVHCSWHPAKLQTWRCCRVFGANTRIQSVLKSKRCYLWQDRWLLDCVHGELPDILLRVEHDDVELGAVEADQRHVGAQADGDA